MTTAGELTVELKGQDVGLSALLQKIDAQAQKSADSALHLSQQYARLAQAQGQPVLGAQLLSNSLQSVAGASESATIAVQTQLSRLESGIPIAQQFGGAVSSSLLSVVGPAALATTAIAGVTSVIQSFGEAFEFKAKLDASTASINTLLRGVRDTGEVWAGAARFANEYKLTQQETNEAIQASIRIIRASKAPIEDILGAFARLKVLAPEKTFSDASRALSELQAGQVVSIEHLFNVPRADANAMKKEIEGGADAVQVLNSYLDRTGVSMDAVKAQTVGAMGAMKELAQAQEQLKIAQAEFAQGPGLAILREQIAATSGATRVLTGDTQAMGQSLLQAEASGSGWVQLLAGMSTGSTATANALQDLAQWVLLLQGYQQGETTATDQNTQATVQLGAAMDAERTAVVALATEHEKQTQALIDQIAKKQQTAQASQQLTQVETILANIGNAVAAGQTTAANGALQFANAAGIATSQAYALVAAQAALSNAKPPGISVLGQGGGAYQGEIDRIIKSNADAAKGAKAYQDAQLALARAHKNTAAEVAILRDRQSHYNKTSAEYIQLEAQIVSVQESGKKRTGGRGAGGIKLTDQQRLNNSLIADTEKYQQKYDDLEVQHQQKRLNILEDYYDQVRKATEDFQQEQLDSRASFYDQQGSIESEKIRKASSVAYEQAAVEAGRIAQEKGADVADKYMQAQEKVINDRAKRAQEIEKAAKEGDKGRAEYLKGVDANYRKAEDAKIARVQEGEGSLAEERDKRLSEEEKAYEEQGGKLADHAEASADRRIAAAQRAGKAIDEEVSKASALQAAYDKIAPNAPTAATPAPTAATPVPATTPVAAPTIAVAPTDPIVAAIGSAKDSLVAALSAIEKAAKETTGAVKQIKATGGVAG